MMAYNDLPVLLRGHCVSGETTWITEVVVCVPLISAGCSSTYSEGTSHGLSIMDMFSAINQEPTRSLQWFWTPEISLKWWSSHSEVVWRKIEYKKFKYTKLNHKFQILFLSCVALEKNHVSICSMGQLSHLLFWQTSAGPTWILFCSGSPPQFTKPDKHRDWHHNENDNSFEQKPVLYARLKFMLQKEIWICGAAAAM